MSISLRSSDEFIEQVQIQPDTVRGTAGYHRVGKDQRGHWWLIDPDDKPWVFKGVAGLNRAGTQGGRYAKPGAYHDAIGEKFGEDPQPFVDSCFQIMADVGMNAAGSWVTEEFFDQGVPYTEITEFVQVGGPDRPFQIKAAGVRCPDVFDGDWLKAIDQQAERICGPRRECRDLIGYFTDNELGLGQANADHVWGGGEELNTKGPTLLQSFLSLPEDRPARAAAERFVLDRHETWQAVGEAWDAPIASREDVAKLTDDGRYLATTGYGRDQDAFSAHYGQTYFRKTSEAIRRHDPNHLVLGCRFGGLSSDWIARAQHGYVDVMSANNYRHNFLDRIDEHARLTGDMPILIGEFSWASDYFRITALPEEPATVREHPEQGVGEYDRVTRWAKTALEQAFTHPMLIGYTWYRWVHTWDDPDRWHYGLVNRRHELNRYNARLMRESHPRLEAIKADLETPVDLVGSGAAATDDR